MGVVTFIFKQAAMIYLAPLAIFAVMLAVCLVWFLVATPALLFYEKASGTKLSPEAPPWWTALWTVVLLAATAAVSWGLGIFSWLPGA